MFAKWFLKNKGMILLSLSFFIHFFLAAQTITGRIVGENDKPLPFATIKLGETKQGVVADLNGYFSINLKPGITYLEISYLNYETQRVPVNADSKELKVVLQAAPANLQEVVVKVTSNKLRRILNTAIENRSLNNPDHYDWYRCRVYYKMVADATFYDSSTIKKDTSKDFREFREMMDKQHVMVAETYSRRTWQPPSKLQEEIIATRMSGFEKSLFPGLVTDVLPFHAYNDFIAMNGKEYHNPMSKGLFQRFQFSLTDELLQGKDTVWIIKFAAKKADELSGTVFIHSDGFAISQIIAQNFDSLLNRHVGIEQQYIRSDGRWFPEKLNYTLKFRAPFPIEMRGTSLIDSIEWKKDERFRFDKAHTVKLVPGADIMHDSVWKDIRPYALQTKEEQTYVVMDSLGKKAGLSRLMGYMQKLTEGKFPVGSVDLLLPRIYSYNQYENSRLGLGLQTNEKISSRFSLGGWAGYGTGDKSWKYGGFAELYADKYKETVFQFSYYNDLRDPGRLQISPELDKNVLRMFLLSRVDKIEGWRFSVTKRLGYLSGELSAAIEDVTPRYDYSFENGGKLYNTFSTREATMNLRYAYGERTSPLFGKYYSTGSKYPVVYARVNAGMETNTSIYYTQAVAAISWQKTINRWGNERILIVGGKTFTSQQVPFPKLFAGNGFLMDKRALYFFGGMQTMRPYDYYSDRFVNLYYLHTFPFNLFDLKISKKGFSSTPNPALAYNGLWGGMKNPGAHHSVSFSVPDKGYHEAGLLLNNVLKLKVMGMAYLGLQAGYFYHFDGQKISAKNGRFVYGLSMSL